MSKNLWFLSCLCFLPKKGEKLENLYAKQSLADNHISPEKLEETKSRVELLDFCSLVLALVVMLPVKKQTVTVVNLSSPDHRASIIWSIFPKFCKFPRWRVMRSKCIFRIETSHETMNATFVFFCNEKFVCDIYVEKFRTLNFNEA